MDSLFGFYVVIHQKQVTYSQLGLAVFWANTQPCLIRFNKVRQTTQPRIYTKPEAHGSRTEGSNEKYWKWKESAVKDTSLVTYWTGEFCFCQAGVLKGKKKYLPCAQRISLIWTEEDSKTNQGGFLLDIVFKCIATTLQIMCRATDAF